MKRPISTKGPGTARLPKNVTMVKNPMPYQPSGSVAGKRPVFPKGPGGIQRPRPFPKGPRGIQRPISTRGPGTATFPGTPTARPRPASPLTASSPRRRGRI